VSQNKNWELLVATVAPSGKKLYGAILPSNAYQCTKFQLPRGGPAIKSEAANLP